MSVYSSNVTFNETCDLSAVELCFIRDLKLKKTDIQQFQEEVNILSSSIKLFREQIRIWSGMLLATSQRSSKTSPCIVISWKPRGNKDVFILIAEI